MMRDSFTWLRRYQSRITIKIIFLIREVSYYLRYRFASAHDQDFRHLAGKRKCIVCLAANYGNLGDVAITYAQTKFLSEKFPDCELVDFPIDQTISHLRSLKKVCTSEDIITLTGGGYMGDLYFRSELLRQLILKEFRKNRIISFPQTADFSDSEFGKQLLEQAKRVYSRCSRLELWAREKPSFQLMQTCFPRNHVRLMPDIVMTLDEFKPNTARSGVTFCLRNDLEKNANTDMMVNEIKDILALKDERMTYYDTHLGAVFLDITARERELRKIWEQFRKSRLVITDRLHGMIFAYITGTPALVLQNSNFKIAACYQWISQCGYIHLVKEVEEVLNVLDKNCEHTEEGFRKTHDMILNAFEDFNYYNN